MGYKPIKLHPLWSENSAKRISRTIRAKRCPKVGAGGDPFGRLPLAGSKKERTTTGCRSSTLPSDIENYQCLGSF